MPITRKEIEERFDETFKGIWNSNYSDFIRIPEVLRNNMKSFILSLLIENMEEVKGKIAELRKQGNNPIMPCPRCRGSVTHYPCLCHIYREGVFDCEQIINNHQQNLK